MAPSIPQHINILLVAEAVGHFAVDHACSDSLFSAALRVYSLSIAWKMARARRCGNFANGQNHS